MTELRRFILDPTFDPDLTRLGTIVNRLIDMANGNATGRMWLLGDDGDRQEILGGDVIDSNNYPLRVEPGSTNQLNILHSNGSTIGLRVQDTGLTTGVPASLTSTLAVTGATTLSSTLAVTGATTLSSTLAVTGATTLSSTLAVTGATTLSSTLAVTGATTLTGALTANAAVTLGDAAADVITVTGTASFAEIVTMAKGLVVDTTTLVVDAVNNKVGIGAVPASTDAQLSTTGYIASTGDAGAPTTNANMVFMFYNTPVSSGFLRAQNRNTSTWLPLVLDGLSTDIRASNVSTIKVDATGIGYFGHSTAAQPAAAAAATDLATVITLANSLRTGLRGSGQFS